MSDSQTAMALVALAIVIGHFRRGDVQEQIRLAESEGERRMLAAIRMARDYFGGE